MMSIRVLCRELFCEKKVIKLKQHRVCYCYMLPHIYDNMYKTVQAIKNKFITAEICMHIKFYHSMVTVCQDELLFNQWHNAVTQTAITQ